MNKGNIIYAYKKVSNNKIVYVGQTTDIQYRHKQHCEYDPFNINNKEYDYPLSRGIRKHGESEYQLIILENNIPKEKLNEREKYWIQYYNTYFNGYNQTIGGQNPTKPIFTEKQIDKVIEMLKNPSFSYDDIESETNISKTHIHNINIGKRRKRDNIQYPIRQSNIKGSKGLKFSQQECEQIHKEILYTNKTFKQIGKEYNCNMETIRRINYGKTKNYLLKGYSYPLRKKQ